MEIILFIYICRLLHEQKVSEIKISGIKNRQDDVQKQNCSYKFTTPKSNLISSDIYSKSLSEIFDVLLITAQLNNDNKTVRTGDIGSIIDNDLRLVNDILNDSPGRNFLGSRERHNSPIKVNPNTNIIQLPKRQNLLDELNQTVSVIGANSQKSVSTEANDSTSETTSATSNSTGLNICVGKESVLDTVLALPIFLRPKTLADAISIIIKKRSPLTFTREEFINNVKFHRLWCLLRIFLTYYCT
jgi:hypothetical protein